MMEAILVAIIHKLGSLIANEGEFLSGVGDGVDWLRDELHCMRSFLQDADSFADEDQTNMMWVDKIRDVVYDSEDIIDFFDLERDRGRRRVRAYTCFIFHLISRHGIGYKITEIRSRLDEISRRKLEYKIELGRGGENLKLNQFRNRSLHCLASSPFVHDGDMVGVEKDLELLLEWVLGGGAELSVVSLVGMGGVGKTTLVKKVYNHQNVKRRFDRYAWIYVSQSIQLRELLLEMSKGLMEIPTAEIEALSEKQMQEMLLSSLDLEEKSYLVVFDDVWDKHLWEAIKLVLPKGANGSRVIITTRNNEVASSVVNVTSHVHFLRPLSSKESWALFCKQAFRNEFECCPKELTELAKEVVKKCDGLPLAVVTVGGMMSRKERTQVEWKCILDNIHRDFQNDEIGIRHALLLSYKDLPCFLKTCFLFCSVFPHDSDISRKRLIRLWVAEGFINEERGEAMEDVAEKYLIELISRSMLQVSKMSTSGRVKACRVHDLLHQLAISISEKENFSAVCENNKTEIPKKARRFSIQKSYCKDAAFNEGKMRCRSLLVFGMSEPYHFSHYLPRNLSLLRVLDLEDACLGRLPSEVGDLIHLRYLGLKGTMIKKLPKSLKKLYNLQTLDIRRTHLRKLSFGMNNLKQLRHLEMKQVGQSVEVQWGLGRLERLQVVTGLRANKVIIHEIANLSQLRKLGIEGVQAEEAVDLCSSINNMSCLSSLSIFSKDADKLLELGTLRPPLFLQKLHLVGCLERLPDWFNSLQNLTKLRLGLSQLCDDPLPILQALPNLLFLQLYEGYRGKVMKCNNSGFRKLKILILTELGELEEWEVEEGTMPCIQELWIMLCSRLKMIPSGIEFLTTMQKLRLVSMPEDFSNRLNPLDGEDFTRVQHIPSIQVL